MSESERNIPEDFVRGLQPLEVSEVIDFLERKNKSKFCTAWVIRNEIKAVDLYCYLGARFKAPNGLQNFLRSDDSDNLVHWEWMVKSGDSFVIIHGLNYRSEVWITNKKFDDADRLEFIDQLKSDFSAHGKKMGNIRSHLEHWTEFVNPYKRVRNAIIKLLAEIDNLNLDADASKNSDLADSLDMIELERVWKEEGSKYSRALGFSFGVRSMLPVMAEAFVNLLLYQLMKPELAKDERIKENIIRQPIDIRIKSLSNNCFGFKIHIDYTNQICKDYHSLVNDRNDLLHGNVVIEKLKFNDLYFYQKVPIFKKYSTMWDRAFGIEQQFVGLDVIKKELQVVDSLIDYLVSCLDEKLQENVRRVADEFFLGINSENGRLGVLFPTILVDMGIMPEIQGVSTGSVVSDRNMLRGQSQITDINDDFRDG